MAEGPKLLDSISLDPKSPGPKSLANISCAEFKGVGPKMLEHLERLSIYSVQDLLFHLPLNYQDQTRIAPMADLRPGDDVVVQGIVQSSKIIKARRGQWVIELQDGTGHLQLRFFHFNRSQMDGVQPGHCLRCFGEVRRGQKGLTMIHPGYQRIDEDAPLPVSETLTPVYPTTQGLQQTSLRRLTDNALTLLQQGAVISELLPPQLLADFSLPRLSDALMFVHRPPPDASVSELTEGVHPFQIRLAFEELLAHHLSLRKLRMLAKSQKATAFVNGHLNAERFLAALPFTLTRAQQRVIAEIIVDLQQPVPMTRLVQGDVGSGKTVVAARAILQAIENDHQAVLMAPTDLLAEQHYVNLQAWFEPLEINVVSLAGKHKGKTRQKTLDLIASGEAKVIVGTHALFQDAVNFKNLSLIVIDEQHRFGVHQRLALREKGMQADLHPHQLVLTATPIPRTMAMALYADLDISIIDELPPSRTPIKTVVLSNQQRANVIDRVREACQQGRQVYWVCPLIEESEVLQSKAAEDLHLELQTALPGQTIGLIHGRMKPPEKEAIMQAFKSREMAVLVATTVIEVGVDVPNASVMVIENAERFGLSQLHQLRGRVGRGSQESFCLLLYQHPLSKTAKARLSVLRETTDGFAIAEKDLAIRGPGEVLGTKQTGMQRFKIADFRRDRHLIPKIQQAADQMLKDFAEHVPMLIQRWLGNSDQYGEV